MSRLSHRPPVNHYDVAERARRTPGEWVRAGSYRSSHSAAGMALMVRKGNKAYAPAGDYEAQIALGEYDTDLWVRYVGKPDKRGEMMALAKDMGDAHEAHVAEVLGMRQARGSGNQWRDPIDGRHNRLDSEWAFAHDGKSTMGKGITITRAMWAKAVEQAGGERPMLTLRWYKDPSLSRVDIDLAAVELLDFAGMREGALKWEKARPLIEALVERDPRCIPVLVDSLRRLLQEEGQS